jgi:phage shock protein A
MGIMTRMLRLCKADVHGVMDQLEDKGLLLKQYLREMEADLEQKEQKVRLLVQRKEDLERQITRHGEEMKKIETDLELALKKEKNDIARMLIRQRRMLATASRHLEAQVEPVSREKEALKATLTDQKLQYDTLKVKADAYCRQAGSRLLEAETNLKAEKWSSLEPRKEEIELELLRRKETLREKGGRP